MIFGIGTDIVSVGRIAEGLERHGERYAQRILGDQELAEFQSSQQQAHFLAKRFAAKEAFVKALGTGFRDGISLREIQVTHTPHGRPGLLCSGEAQRKLLEFGVGESHLSLADEKEFAIAFVTLLKRQNGL
ncbi:MAG: holo-ACP synthase [Pseudomonadota bacterium]